RTNPCHCVSSTSDPTSKRERCRPAIFKMTADKDCPCFSLPRHQSSHEANGCFRIVLRGVNPREILEIRHHQDVSGGDRNRYSASRAGNDLGMLWPNPWE